ncbi:MAG: 2-hydroxyglutaryl-CoA dehydratase, partial [Eubacteriales bacterium]
MANSALEHKVQPAARLTVGLDVGSTTAKIAVVRDGKLLFERYVRHYSKIRETLTDLIREAGGVIGNEPFTAALSGSAGLGLANAAGIPFVQEVWATGEVIRRIEPDTSAVIELGGEDAKIIFFDGGCDERMNGTCA